MNLFTAILTRIFKYKFRDLGNKTQVMDFSMNETSDIITAVRTYIDTPQTNYAIMIDGVWGCGKTHLWKEIIAPKIDDKESIYISLFGLESIKDIDNEIFKKMSRLGDDDNGILKGILNSNPEVLEGVRIGGIGFAVQFGLNKWKEISMVKSKKMLLCFDDLERWAGEIDVCLSYINKLVEHEGVKCLAIGNINDFNEDKIKTFNVYKEKTIKYIYKLEYSPKWTIEYSIKLANYPCKNSELYINKLLSENLPRIFSLLDRAKYSNIRTISTAISFMATIYANKKEDVSKSPTMAISYFESLLSLMILLDKYSENDKTRLYLLDPDIDGSTKYRKIRFSDENDDDIKVEIKNVDDTLLAQALFIGQDTVDRGRFSIIKYGFFKNNDFEQDFANWKTTEDYELYLDTFKFWCFENEESESIYQNTYSAVFNEKKITNPVTLLTIADRMTCDIKRGLVDLNLEKTIKNFQNLFDDLYANNKIDIIKNLNLDWGGEKFYYCSDLFYYVKKKNDEYLEKHEFLELSFFWSKIKKSSVNYNSFVSQLDTFDRRFKLTEIFSQYSSPNEIIDILSSFQNDQLFALTRWMGSKIEAESKNINDDSIEYKKSEIVAKTIEDLYKNEFTVKSGHMKQIVRIIKNKRSDYDPEFIDQLRKRRAQ